MTEILVQGTSDRNPKKTIHRSTMIVQWSKDCDEIRLSVINQYGRLTKLSSEFVEAISKHSPILKFVETSNWSSLGNYFEDRKEGNIVRDQRIG